MAPTWICRCCVRSRVCLLSRPCCIAVAQLFGGLRPPSACSQATYYRGARMVVSPVAHSLLSVAQRGACRVLKSILPCLPSAFVWCRLGLALAVRGESPLRPLARFGRWSTYRKSPISRRFPHHHHLLCPFRLSPSTESSLSAMKIRPARGRLNL